MYARIQGQVVLDAASISHSMFVVVGGYHAESQCRSKARMHVPLAIESLSVGVRIRDACVGERFDGVVICPPSQAATMAT